MDSGAIESASARDFAMSVQLLDDGGEMSEQVCILKVL